MKAHSTSHIKADNALITAKVNIKEIMLQQTILKMHLDYLKEGYTAFIIKSHQNILINT